MAVIRVSVTLAADLHERMVAADLSPSALLTQAVRDALGDANQPSAADRLAQLETRVEKLASTQAKLVRELNAANRRVRELASASDALA